MEGPQPEMEMGGRKGPGFDWSVGLADILQAVVLIGGLIAGGAVLNYKVEQVDKQHAMLGERLAENAAAQSQLEKSVQTLHDEVRSLNRLLYEKRVLRSSPGEQP